MEEQVLFNQIKALIKKEFHGLKAENDKLKKENQEIKETIAKLCQLCKVDLEHPSQNGNDDKKQSTDYKLIDLGLSSGTLWMDRNIGASSPTDSGLYFAWGETQGYTADEVGKNKQFSWEDYKHCCAYIKLTKYCSKSSYGNDGYTDSLVTLQTTDDAVYQFTNGECSMPTKEQLQELIDNTTYEWTMQDGVNGGLFTSKINGNSIFIPAAGYCDYSSVDSVGEDVFLWVSSLYEDDLYSAWNLYFYSEGVDCYYGRRYCGIPVRGVAVK